MVLLQAAGQQQSMWPTLFMMIALFAIMYFTMIRPQSKKQKEIKTFRAGLEIGSKIVTAGGIYGTIKELNELWAMVEIAQGVKIKVDLNSIFPSADSGIAKN